MNTQAQRKLNILLIGDDCVDVYQYGTIERLSPEAPVPVFKLSHKEERGGMARNVKDNLEKLGCNVSYLCGETSIKTRLIDVKSKQHIVRIDNDIECTPIEFATAIPLIYDAVLISDYEKGTVSYEMMEEIIAQSKHSAKVPVFIDTKKHDLDRLQGAWVKINQHEYAQLKSEPSGLIVTKGPNGASVVHHDFECTAPVVEVVDVTGAGDTFLAALAYKYLLTKDIKAAVEFANKAASVTVQHLGCYAPRLEEIE
jgi:D-beta-D-heptose 7-phosphate kinase/D-beta-D-heptose 1-phosphate adenosyltransferase